MSNSNLSRKPLSRAKLDALPPGRHVIDGDMNILTKRSDDRWQGEYRSLATSTLYQNHGPIRLWTGAVR